VYCEVSPHQPYVIRKIEELTKTPCGNVEAKVICAYRYQDIPANIMATVEKYQAKERSDAGEPTAAKEAPEQPPKPNDYDESDVSELSDPQRYQLKHRELYFSKVSDTIAATTIRSKCSVLLFNEEVERYADYVARDDQFYYHLTYDPYARSIVNDKGEIKVGSRYQTEIPMLKYTPNGVAIDDNEAIAQAQEQEKKHNDRVLRSQKIQSGKEQMPEIPILLCPEELQWCPFSTQIGEFKNGLSDQEIDQFLILAKSVGTFGRALDCNNAFKQPSLPLSAAYASRDITLLNAMNVLHESNYEVGRAALALIGQSGPIVCKDEMEAWSASEANIFEDALEKFGKDFNEIHREQLPWKSMRSIIEYYYQWKTTDRWANFLLFLFCLDKSNRGFVTHVSFM
jgi:metastasis-associated protein MTA